MYKLIATWSAPRPEDLAAFERHYHDVHLPLAAKAPGMRRLLLTRSDSGLEGSPPAWHRTAELHFDDPAALEKSSHSGEWAAMRADAGKMIERFGVSLSVSMGWEEEVSLS